MKQNQSGKYVVWHFARHPNALARLRISLARAIGAKLPIRYDPPERKVRYRRGIIAETVVLYLEMKNYLKLILLTLLLTSCECWVFVDGKVIDSETKKPIKRAWVGFENIKCTEIISSTVATEKVNCIFTTDSIGSFSMQSDNYGICPDKKVKIKIRKYGYKTKIVELNNENFISDLKIELEKE